MHPKKNLPSGTETFMDVLAALIVSEEFQGIVASETGDTKFPDNVTSSKSTLRSVGPNIESVPSNFGGDSEKSKGIILQSRI